MELERLISLQGARLTLRAPRLDDAASVFAYASDPEVSRFLAWPCHSSLADSERFLLSAVDGWQSGRNLVWMIEDDRGVVGSIGAEVSCANAGIGYVVARPCWGRGYATEALGLVSAALFRWSPVRALWALCVTENAASARVLEKCGFHSERTLGNYFSCPNLAGEMRDVSLYGREKHAGEAAHRL